MSCSATVNIFALIVWIFVAVPIPVKSVLYQVSVNPSKALADCKNPGPNVLNIHDYLDTSKLNISYASATTLSVKGTLTLIRETPNDTISIYIVARQKIRGRWIDTPFTHLMKDFCSIYFKKGTFWHEKFTQYFVGDERMCPPKLHLPLPFDAIVDLTFDIPTHVPTGEYVCHTQVKQGIDEVCYDTYADLNEA